MKQTTQKTAYYHLPGLFEFYELYELFLPLFRKHREYFYDGVRLAPSMGHRQIVSGAADGLETAITVRRKCCI